LIFSRIRDTLGGERRLSPEVSVKVIILAAIAALVIAFAAAFVLDREQEPAYQAFTGSGARVGDPGTNLVGPQWSGLNDPDAPGS
jgi:hypothetical protein